MGEEHVKNGKLGGCPRYYKTVEEFNEKVDEYIRLCDEAEIKMRTDEYAIIPEHLKKKTWTGMCIHMGFSSRKGLDKYAEYEGFYHPVKRAKLLIENVKENRLDSNSPAGAIFGLKNMGWTDKVDNEAESQTTTKLQIEVVTPNGNSED